MTCPHCGTDTSADAARCATCGSPQAPLARVSGLLGDLDVTGGIPDAGVFETIGSGTPSAGSGTHQFGVDVTRIAPVRAPGGVPTVETGTGMPGTAATGTGDLGVSVARSSGPLKVGQSFSPRYHVIKLLGAGGMGAVYQAWDAELGVAVALKVIRTDPRRSASAEAERRFKNELLLARQVTHKHVVRIHDLGEIDGIKYITMPYVQGDDLATALRAEGKLTVARALRLARQLASGLEAAHDAGVVHRDLKPPNIMIGDAGENEQALIMDFGISASTDEVTEGTIVGTLEYMSPEQGSGQAVDARSDLYSFGVILFEMLAGPRAEAGKTGQERIAAMRQRFADGFPSLRTIDETIPEPLAALVARCVERAPAARFQTTRELTAALARLDDQGQLIPEVRRLTKKLQAAAAAVLVVLLATTWYFARGPKAPVTHPPVSILVADFDNRTGDAVFDGALEQPLTISMEGASFISAYPRDGARKLAQTLQNAARLDAASARPVAFRENVKYVLAGSVASAGGKYQLTLDALDPATGKAVRSASATAASKSDVLAAVGALAARMRTSLGDTASESVKLAASESFTAGSIDAMREYSLAQDLQNNGRNDDALAHYGRAIELDPKFGRAYAGAANINFRLGRQVEAEAQFKQALSLMDRMTDREKHRTLGSYYLQIVLNYQKAADEYSALVRAYPSDSGGHANLAFAYFGLSDYARAMEEGKRAVETDPRNITAKYNLALFAMYAGNFTNAASTGRAVIAENPASVKAYLPPAVDAIIRGDLAAADAAYDGMAKASSSGASLAGIGRADLRLYRGSDGVVADLKAGVAADLGAKSTIPAAVKQIQIAEAELAAGRRAQAFEAAHAALAITHQPAIIVPAARVLLRAGKAAEARALAAELEGQLQRSSRAYGKIVLAEIALEDKKPAEAVDLLTQARGLADLWLGRFDLGIAFVQANAFAEAIPEFEACEKRRGEATALFFDDRPTVRYLATLPYWLGRAQEGLFQAAPAKASYEAFLKIRGGASADPLVQDARRRLPVH